MKYVKGYISKPRDYLSSEDMRNRQNAALYSALVKAAHGDVTVFVGHHISFQKGGDITTENEIPSADSALFCHEIMTAVFGDSALDIMAQLARTPSAQREAALAMLWADYRHGEEQKARDRFESTDPGSVALATA